MEHERPDFRTMDWEDLTARLLLAALKIVGGYPNRHQVAKDLAQEAIVKTLAGRRPWNHHDYTLFQHLCGVVKGEFFHLKGKAQRETSLDDDKVIKLADVSPSPESVQISKSELDDLLSYIGHRNRDAERIAILILENHPVTSAELADISGFKVTKVEYLKKSLKLIAQDYCSFRGIPLRPRVSAAILKISGGKNVR